jgi:hypothetical protein
VPIPEFSSYTCCLHVIEHWSVHTKAPLDAKSSEYIYKHHITRLEDIYSNRKTVYPPSPGLLYMSPVSQLYGFNGKLMVKENEVSGLTYLFVSILNRLTD